MGVGNVDGSSVGLKVGLSDGFWEVGCAVEGVALGLIVGFTVGLFDWTIEGLAVGISVGWFVRTNALLAWPRNVTRVGSSCTL